MATNLQTLAQELVENIPNLSRESAGYIREEMEHFPPLRDAYETGTVAALQALPNPAGTNDHNSIFFDYHQFADDIKLLSARSPTGTVPYPFGNETWGDRVDARVWDHFLYYLVDLNFASGYSLYDLAGLSHTSGYSLDTFQKLYETKIGRIGFNDSTYLVKLGCDTFQFDRDLRLATSDIVCSDTFQSGINSLQKGWTSKDPVLQYNQKRLRFNNHLMAYTGSMGDSKEEAQKNRQHKQAVYDLLRTEGYYDKWNNDVVGVNQLYRQCELKLKDKALEMCDRAQDLLGRLHALYVAIEDCQDSK